MIIGVQTKARNSTIVNKVYDEPFDLGLRTQDIATRLLIRQDLPEFTVLAPIL